MKMWHSAPYHELPVESIHLDLVAVWIHIADFIWNGRVGL